MLFCDACDTSLSPPAGRGKAEQQQHVSQSPLEPAAKGVQEPRADEEEVHSRVGVLRLLHLQHLRLPQGEACVLFESFFKSVFVY